MQNRPKFKIQNLKTLEDNTGENLGDISYIDDLFWYKAKALSMKEIIDKLNFIMIKNLLCERLYQENEKKSYKQTYLFILTRYNTN